MLGVGPHGPTGPAAPSRRPRTAEGEAGYGAAGGVAGIGAPASGESASPASREAMAVIAAVEGIGPITLERLLAAFGDPVAVLEVAARPGGVSALRAATRDSDDRLPTMRDSTAEALAEAARRPGEMAARLDASGVHVILLGEAAYPRRLHAIELPPRLLFVRGADAALDGRHSVAVVGTRRPTDEGRRTANRIGAALARAGTLVVSGLALGIDGAAHAAVLGEGGQTVAVIGGGHDRLFPRAHDRLADAIVDGGGAVISEHAPGTQPTKGTFPRRNRVISGLADAVVVVEAGARSGALVTAAWALEQGRECFLVPGSIEAPLAAGCLAWLRDYAGLTRIVAGVPQLLEDLGLDGLAAFPPRPGRGADPTNATGLAAGRQGARPAGAFRPHLGPAHPPSLASVTLDVPQREARLLGALDRGAATVDELVATTGLPVAAVLGGLTGLEDRGLVEEAYGRYRVPSGAVAPAVREADPAA